MAGTGTSKSGKRRAHGEGTIVHGKDGRWQAGISLGDGTRKRRWFRTQTEARRWLTKTQRDRDQGLPLVRDERLTLAAYLDSWLAAKRATIRPRPWESHEEHVRLHIVPTLGRIRLSQLTPQQVQALYAAKLDAGLSPQTVRHVHSTLRCALNEAVELGVIPVAVTRRVKPPRVPRREMLVYDPAQARHLLDTARGDRLEALYALVLTTGMREGELFALRWRDVDLDTRHLQVVSNVQRVRGRGAVVFEPKTPSGRRHLALTATAVAALRAHRNAQRAERLAAGPAWEDRDLVFATSHGTPYAPQNFHRQHYKPLLKRAGLPYVRFHDLRHTAATLLLLRGVHIKVVSEMLGHASIAITLNLYGHVLPTMQAAAVAAMDGIFGA